MRRLFFIIVAAAGLLVIAAAAGMVYRGVYVSVETGGETQASELFIVRAGEPFGSVAERLAEKNFVRKPRVIRGYAWIRGIDKRVKAGTYSLTRGDRPKDILAKLVAGDVYKVSVTIPEGFMVTQIAGALAAALEIDSTAFAALAGDPELLERAGAAVPSLEGYFFPDTYLIPWGMSAREIAVVMIERLDDVMDARREERAREVGLTRHDVLTLASIVEAETRLAEELPLVSAVYNNRLKKGMRLEADPTVAYAMGGYKGRLYFKDLEIDSPYNTYKHTGLPPGPICSPGEAAIEAALYPDSTFKAIYFVAKGNGGHIFSLTLKDHLAAVQKVKRNRSAD